MRAKKENLRPKKKIVGKRLHDAAAGATAAATSTAATTDNHKNRAVVEKLRSSSRSIDFHMCKIFSLVLWLLVLSFFLALLPVLPFLMFWRIRKCNLFDGMLSRFTITLSNGCWFFSFLFSMQERKYFFSVRWRRSNIEISYICARVSFTLN